LPGRPSSSYVHGRCLDRQFDPGHQEGINDPYASEKKLSNSFVSYLLSCIKEYQDHVAELLTSSAEQRLARVLLRLANLDRKGPSDAQLPALSDQVLAEMVGTTRSRINLFMNRFRKQGFISYNGGIEVHRSLRKVVRSR
jgi:CRP/FNR family cyclic AMP-dependent transcriptional regulator